MGMKIGNIETENNLVLAPMAGYTDAAFRSICVEQGAGMTYTEMISAKALYYKNKNTKPLLQLAGNEKHVALQLFGNEPELLAEEAAKLEDGPYEMFDVNMACPVPKVVNNGEGSALMLQPELVGKIVSTMVKRLKKPVSVKIRKGFNDRNINAPEIARIAEDAGASLIAIHGRTREQMYHGQADYDIIRQVKEAVSIPVLGSGDVYTAEDAGKMMNDTGADGVMVARGARGNPWIFRQISDSSFTGPDLPDLKNMINHHMDLMLRWNSEDSSVRQMRKHVGFYAAGFPNAVQLRRDINSCESLEHFREIIDKWNS
ncbi:MAG: tRNA dihydrouridine synthase DusB [Parasporobacterium sp.]|nr:tRNA dihydrouridine synthase DusB [Parasporobacterium sp.]